MADETQKPKIIGIEVWTGESGGHWPGDYLSPTQYISIDMDGIVDMGSGYPGGTYWIRYEDGRTDAYMENAVRRVMLK